MEKVTIRVLPEKLQIYPRFRDLVRKELGSDVCFVTTSLWEAFLQAMDQVPPAPGQMEMKFMRQNVQINIGCQFLYMPKKVRRYPGTDQIPGFPFYIDKKKNYFFPLLLEEWGRMGEQQKQFWRERMIEQGILPPSVSTGKPRSPIKKFFKTLEDSMTKYVRTLKRWLRRRKDAQG